MDARIEERIARKLANESSNRRISRIAKSIVSSYSNLNAPFVYEFYQNWKGREKFEGDMNAIASAMKEVEGIDDAKFLEDRMLIDKDYNSGEGVSFIEMTACGKKAYVFFSFSMGYGWSGWARVGMSDSANYQVGMKSVQTNKLVDVAVRNAGWFAERMKNQQQEAEKGKRYKFGWDSRGTKTEVWIELKGVDDNEKEAVADDIERRFPKAGFQYDRGSGSLRREIYGGDAFGGSDLAKEPYKSVCDYLESQGYKREE